MNNQYINELSPYLKNVLMRAQLQSISENNKKSIKFEYVIKAVIADIFLFALICTVTILFAFGGTDNTNMILVMGGSLSVVALILSILITSYVINETYKNSYILQAYVANTQLWNDGHTKVYIVYYDKKREKFVLVEKFLSMKNNRRRYEIKHDFIDIVVKEKKNKMDYLLTK